MKQGRIRGNRNQLEGFARTNAGHNTPKGTGWPFILEKTPKGGRIEPPPSLFYFLKTRWKQ